MKFLKILAVIMAVCMLGSAFIACDKDSGDGEAELPTADVQITLVIKEGSVEKYRDTVKCNGYLENAIEMFCAGEFEEEFTIFDNNNLLHTIGELSAGNGKRWKAYYEDEGQSKAFDYIKLSDEIKEEIKKDNDLAKKYMLIDGKTVILVLE